MFFVGPSCLRDVLAFDAALPPGRPEGLRYRIENRYEGLHYVRLTPDPARIDSRAFPVVPEAFRVVPEAFSELPEVFSVFPEAVRDEPCPVHVTPSAVSAVSAACPDAPALVPDVPRGIPVVPCPLHVAHSRHFSGARCLNSSNQSNTMLRWPAPRSFLTMMKC